MAKHTPGPWIRQEWGKPANPYIIAQTCVYPSPRTTVAWGEPTGGQGWPAVGDAGVFDREMVEANAKLIAAAPDLLAACKAEHSSEGSGPRLLRDAADVAKCTSNFGLASALRIMADQIEAALKKVEGV